MDYSFIVDSTLIQALIVVFRDLFLPEGSIGCKATFIADDSGETSHTNVFILGAWEFRVETEECRRTRLAIRGIVCCTLLGIGNPIAFLVNALRIHSAA